MSPLIPVLWEHFIKGGAQMPEEIPPDCTIERTRAGRNQQAAGAWSWYLWSQQDHEAARVLMMRGSCCTARSVARARKVSCLIESTTAELYVEEP